jgi:hypothetical protein
MKIKKNVNTIGMAKHIVTVYRTIRKGAERASRMVGKSK